MHVLYSFFIFLHISICLGTVSATDFAVEVVNHIPDRWESFGVALGVPLSNVKSFERQYMGNARDIFNRIFEHWINHQSKLNYPPTWESIVEILRTRVVDEKHLADDIEKKYCHK